MTEPASTPSTQWTTTGVPLEITHHEVRAAHETGEARPLSNVITDIVTYRGHWWIAHTHSWLLITDEPTIARLNRHVEWANPKLLRDSP
jgi:hypothetical protein